MASEVSLSGYVLSMTGVIFPRFEKIPEDGHRVLLARHREVRFGQLFHKEGEKHQFEEVGDEPERALA